MDFFNLCKTKQNGKNLYSSKQTERIQSIVLKASEMIHKEGGARSARKALKVLEIQIEELKAITSKPSERKHNKNIKCHFDDDNVATYFYQEEADPEVFFVKFIF